MKKTKPLIIIILSCITFISCSIGEDYKSYEASIVFKTYWTNDISETKDYNRK